MNQFINFCENLGLIVNRLPPEGIILRTATTEKPRSKNGAIYWEKNHAGKIIGWAQNHQTMEKPLFYRSEITLDTIQTKRWQKERFQKEALRRQSEQMAIKKAKDWFKALSPLKGLHPYLQKKGLSGIGCFGLKVENEHLVIPLYGENKTLISCQTISPDGKEKRFFPGCPTALGHFTIVRKNFRLLLFSEGFATGLALFQSILNAAVVVCFNAGNLEGVARLFKEKYASLYQGKRIIVCADNDYETEQKTGRNPGLFYAEKAATILGSSIAYPKGIKGTDWADALIEWENPHRVQMEVLKSL